MGPQTMLWIHGFYYVGNIALDISGMPARSSAENKSAKPTSLLTMVHLYLTVFGGAAKRFVRIGYGYFRDAAGNKNKLKYLKNVKICPKKQIHEL